MTTYILIGQGGSGKTTARRHLETLGFNGFEASEYAKRLIETNPELEINAILDQYGRDIVAQNILSEMDDDPSVISEFRTPEEIERVKQARQTMVIYIEADIRTCFERVQKRDNGRYGSLSEFVEKKIRADEKLGLMEARAMADMIVENSGEMMDFLKRIESIHKVVE